MKLSAREKHKSQRHTNAITLSRLFPLHAHLQSGSMHNPIVDSELLTTVIQYEHAHATTSIVKRIAQSFKQTALVKYRQAMLHVASLCHGDNASVATNVKHTVLLKDRSEHVLHDNRWARVRDKRALLMQLFREEINTEIAVLASCRRGCDANHLAWSTLKNEQVTQPDVMTWDRDCVWWQATLSHTHTLAGSHRAIARAWTRLLVGAFLVLTLRVVVMTPSVNWMENAVCYTVSSSTERMIMSVFVVVAHIPLVLWRAGFFVPYLRMRLGTSVFLGWLTVGFLGVLGVLGAYWTCTLTIISFRYVDGRFGVPWKVTNLTALVFTLVLCVLYVVNFILDVDVSRNVVLIRLLVAGKLVSKIGYAKFKSINAYLDMEGCWVNVKMIRALDISQLDEKGLSLGATNVKWES